MAAASGESSASRGAKRPSSFIRCSTASSPSKEVASASPVEMSQKHTPAPVPSTATAQM